MGATGKFIHRAVEAGTPVTTYSTAYNVANKAIVDMLSDAPRGFARANRFTGHISSILIEGNVAGGATKLTIKGYSNSVGTDDMWLEPVEVALEPQIGVGTIGSAIIYLGYDIVLRSGTVTLFAKTDAGTYAPTKVTIIWEE